MTRLVAGALVVLLLTRVVHAEPRERDAWLPTTALALGSVAEQVEVRLDGAQYAYVGRELRPGVVVGLVHPVPQPAAWSLRLEGHASVTLSERP